MPQIGPRAGWARWAKALGIAARAVGASLIASVCAFATLLLVTFYIFFVWTEWIGIEAMRGSPAGGVGALGLAAMAGMLAGAVSFPFFAKLFLSWKDATSLRRSLLRTAKWTFGLAATGLALLAMYNRTFAGTVTVRTPSPDRRLIAEVRTFGAPPAVDPDAVVVRIGRPFNPFRHTVFAGSEHPVRIMVSWTDSSNLLVKCVDCDRLHDQTVENNWNGVAIRYELVSSRKIFDDYLRYPDKSGSH